MKILYIIHSCIMGGATISFINLIRGIREKGNEVVIIHPHCAEKDKKLLNIFNSMSCKCYELPVTTSYNIKKGSRIKHFLRPKYLYLKEKRFFFALIKICKKEKPNIIHTNTGVVHESFFVAKKLKIPHVWHLREYQTLDFNWQILPSEEKFKKFLRESYTVCITKDIQRYFELEDFDKSYVIYNPIMSISETKKTALKIKEKYFLVANRVSSEKGIENIIESFAIFSKNKSDYILKIAGFGDENYIAHLKQKCIDLSVDEKVEFLGFSDNINCLIKNSIALLVGSYNEGFGRMTAEANMLGIPVIGRNTAGTKEILEQTNGGFLFNSNNELTNAMEKISEMDNNQLYSFMKDPKNKAIELFSSEQHINSMLNLYNKITKL